MSILKNIKINSVDNEVVNNAFMTSLTSVKLFSSAKNSSDSKYYLTSTPFTASYDGVLIYYPRYNTVSTSSYNSLSMEIMLNSTISLGSISIGSNPLAYLIRGGSGYIPGITSTTVPNIIYLKKNDKISIKSLPTTGFANDKFVDIGFTFLPYKTSSNKKSKLEFNDKKVILGRKALSVPTEIKEYIYDIQLSGTTATLVTKSWTAPSNGILILDFPIQAASGSTSSNVCYFEYFNLRKNGTSLHPAGYTILQSITTTSSNVPVIYVRYVYAFPFVQVNKGDVFTASANIKGSMPTSGSAYRETISIKYIAFN